jgi:predicted ribosomally synthesized peptide with SipW-like signal peptide
MRIRSKAIVGALGATAVAGAVVMTGTTSAYFFDAETATANTIKAGSLDLEYSLSGSAVQGGEVDIRNMKPGDSETLKVTVKNAGTVAGYLGADVSNVQELENKAVEPERELGDADDTAGELGKSLEVWFDGRIADVPAGNIKNLDEAVMVGFKGRELGAGQSKTVELKIKTPTGKKGDGNGYMTDSYSFDLDLELSQSTFPW